MLYIKLIWKYKWYIVAAAIAALFFFQRYQIRSLRCNLDDRIEEVNSLKSQVDQLKLNHELDEKYNQEYIDKLKSAEEELLELKNKLQGITDESLIKYRDTAVPCGVKTLIRNKNHTIICK